MVKQNSNDVTFSGTVSADGNQVVANINQGQQKAEVFLLISLGSCC